MICQGHTAGMGTRYDSNTSRTLGFLLFNTLKVCGSLPLISGPGRLNGEDRAEGARAALQLGSAGGQLHLPFSASYFSPAPWILQWPPGPPLPGSSSCGPLAVLPTVSGPYPPHGRGLVSSLWCQQGDRGAFRVGMRLVYGGSWKGHPRFLQPFREQASPTSCSSHDVLCHPPSPLHLQGDCVSGAQYP